ncbi:MAG: hypothetical protein QME42_04995 [bacterium]|nr:hypothetical protein [bacterium]
MITFPFVSIYSENLGIVKRPLANILLIGPLKKTVTEMLIDSGGEREYLNHIFSGGNGKESDNLKGNFYHEITKE